MDAISETIMDGFAWLADQFTAFIDLLFNMVVDLLNFGIAAAGAVIGFVVNLLPESDTYPTETIPDVPVDGVVNFINWVLPVESMAAVIGLVVLNYVLYFTLGRVLKVAQVI